MINSSWGQLRVEFCGLDNLKVLLGECGLEQTKLWGHTSGVGSNTSKTPEPVWLSSGREERAR